MFKSLCEYIHKDFDDNFIKGLEGFIKIPNISPDYDKDWKSNGLQEKAAQYVVEWIKSQKIKGLKIEIIQEANYTPLILVEIDPSDPSIKKTLALYGHLDKMPPLDEKLWTEGRKPYDPKIIKGYIYGRGVADDGYSVFAFIGAVKALQALNYQHGKVFCIIEMDEESSGEHISHYISKMKERFADVGFLLCSDNGVANYERIWITSSLRGFARFSLQIEMLNEAIHSGDGGGVIPDSFRILRMLLSRLENPENGELIDEFNPPIPEFKLKEFQDFHIMLTKFYLSHLSFIPGGQFQTYNSENPEKEAYITRSFKSCLCVTGCEGLPKIEEAGNVIRPFIKVMVSMRLAPHLPKEKAKELIYSKLTSNPPYGAKITISDFTCSDGFIGKPLDPKLEKIIDDASIGIFGKGFLRFHDGTTVPFLQVFRDNFKNADIITTGAIGSDSKPHSIDEGLNLTYTKQYIGCLSYLISEYSKI